MKLKRSFVGARPGEAAFAVAASRGYGYIDSSNGRVHDELNVWMTRFTKTADRSGPALWVGYREKSRSWVLEQEIEE